MTDAKTFDAYEVIGVITPGAVLGLLMALQWPDFRALLGQEELSIGGLGLLLVASFVIGHMVQAVGNLLESIVWALPGMPSTWVTRPKQQLLTASQRHQLETKVLEIEPHAADLTAFSRKAWLGVTARLYAKVNAAGRAARVDACNRTYGLSRGLAAAFFLAAVWAFYEDRTLSTEVLVFMGLLIIALYRMVRAGRYYARSLYLTFLDLPATSHTAPTA